MTESSIQAERDRLAQDNAALRERVEQLQRKLDWYQRQLFGEKSEKLRMVPDAHQDDLLAALGQGPNVSDVAVPTEEIHYTRRKRQKSRDNAVTDEGLRFDDNVPVETIEVAAPEGSGEVIDYKSTYRLAQRPASYVILEYRCPVVKDDDRQSLMSVAAPPAVIERSVADVSFMAGLLIDKFEYHIPFYRQHRRLAQGGITLARGTLTNIGRRGCELLSPIHDAQFYQALAERVLALDETPIKAGRKQKGKMRQAYFWPIYSLNDEVVFTYSATHGVEHLERVLGDRFAGVLLSDGYRVYEAFARRHESVTNAQCWTHTRRPFEHAQDAEPEAAKQALHIIAALYRIEREIREQGLTREAKRAYRQRYSAPVVETFWQWCDNQRQRYDLLPSNPLAKAIEYATARRNPLEVFLDDPDVPLDTNHLERALRVIPMGRKNWLFCWTELGAEHVAIVQSLLVTCRLHGIDPYTYLVDVLQRVSQHPASDVAALTPRLWKERFAHQPLRSDIDRLTR